MSPFSNRGIRWLTRPGSSRISGCKVPPNATFISCKPRQMPKMGTPRSTQVSSIREPDRHAARRRARTWHSARRRSGPDARWLARRSAGCRHTLQQFVYLRELRSAGEHDRHGAATSVTARRFRSPTRCAGNWFSARCVVAMMPTTGRFMSASRLPCPQIGKRVVETAERLFEDWSWCCKVEAQPRGSTRARTSRRACINSRALGDPRGDILRRKPSRRKIDPGEIGAVETHGACSGRRSRCVRRTGRDLFPDKAAVRRATLHRSATLLQSPPCRSHCTNQIRSPRSARRASFERRVGNDASADMGAGEIECLGCGHAGDQAIGGVWRGGHGRRVLGAAEHEIAMNFIRHQNQIPSTQRSASAASSSRDQAVPPGLCGLHKKTTLVRGVSLLRSASRSIV